MSLILRKYSVSPSPSPAPSLSLSLSLSLTLVFRRDAVGTAPDLTYRPSRAHGAAKGPGATPTGAGGATGRGLPCRKSPRGDEARDKAGAGSSGTTVHSSSAQRRDASEASTRPPARHTSEASMRSSACNPGTGIRGGERVRERARPAGQTALAERGKKAGARARPRPRGAANGEAEKRIGSLTQRRSGSRGRTGGRA